MRRKILTACLALAAALIPAKVKAVCTVLSGGLGLHNPNFSDNWPVWSTCLQYNFNVLNGSTSTAATFAGVNISTLTGNSGQTVNNTSNYGVYVATNIFMATSANFYTQGSGKIAIATTTPTDVLSVVGSVNITSGLKYNTATGTNGSLTSVQTMCGGTWNNGIYVGGAACTVGSSAQIMWSSQTLTGGNTFTNASFANCQTSMSISGMSANSIVQFHPIFNVSGNGAGDDIGYWILDNGAYTGTQSASKPARFVTSPGTNIPMDMGGYIFHVSGSGSHIFCMGLGTTAGTGTLCPVGANGFASRMADCKMEMTVLGTQ